MPVLLLFLVPSIHVDDALQLCCPSKSGHCYVKTILTVLESDNFFVEGGGGTIGPYLPDSSNCFPRNLWENCMRNFFSDALEKYCKCTKKSLKSASPFSHNIFEHIINFLQWFKNILILIRTFRFCVALVNCSGFVINLAAPALSPLLDGNCLCFGHVPPHRTRQPQWNNLI